MFQLSVATAPLSALQQTVERVLLAVSVAAGRKLAGAERLCGVGQRALCAPQLLVEAAGSSSRREDRLLSPRG